MNRKSIFTDPIYYKLSCRREAMFLFCIKDHEGAIRKLIDAMISLDSLFQKSRFKRPSHDYTTGMFKNLDNMLSEYWNDWNQTFDQKA